MQLLQLANKSYINYFSNKNKTTSSASVKPNNQTRKPPWPKVKHQKNVILNQIPGIWEFNR